MDTSRTVVWLDSTQSLGAARDTSGVLELFLAGPELRADLATIAEQMVFNNWRVAEGFAIAANRLQLGAGDHVNAIAALLAVELLDNGYATDPEGAFRETEPVIATVLERARAEDQVLTGLAGELCFLTELLRGVPAGGPSEAVTATWHGWHRSTRDFQIGSVGVEVKTTTRGNDGGHVNHHIQGTHQVEVGLSVGGSPETALFLFSLVLRWLPIETTSAPTIEGLVQEILPKLPQSAREQFLDNVRHYAGSTLRLDHGGHGLQKSLVRPFMLVSERLYDLDDERLRLPRRSDLAEITHILPDSVSFDISLPRQVRGTMNPIIGLAASVERVRSLAPK
ncbi:PD-(D/E)XK motif protein [Occultella kanbiaonis]|uniref:PD-(D/E)XK motif protein n=1 Tax=Occultella kanbiaonis TaxID=2675754 RepID=UPI00143DF646|nr:PD-(D/E)XK motif protein [Occultella kanbiaonis]